VSKRPRVLVLGWLMGTSVQTSFLLLTALLAEYCGLKLPLSVWPVRLAASKVGRSAATDAGRDWIAGSGAGCVAFAAWGARAFGAGGRAGVEAVVIVGGLIAGVVALVLRRRGNVARS